MIYKEKLSKNAFLQDHQRVHLVITKKLPFFIFYFLFFVLFTATINVEEKFGSFFRNKTQQKQENWINDGILNLWRYLGPWAYIYSDCWQ